MSEWEGLMGILSLAFGLGLLHAMDADHIAAVSTLASGKGSATRRPWQFCIHWALGHGVTLLLIGSAVFIIGVSLPDNLGIYAQGTVGCVLIVMGIGVFYDVRRQSLKLSFHAHNGELQHAHWHQPEACADIRHHDHSATLVGALHGAAGSAPLLALIPVLTHYSVIWGLIYLLIFSLGVLLSMLTFGGLLGVLFTRLAQWGTRRLNQLRVGIAAGSVISGIYVLQGVA